MKIDGPSIAVLEPSSDYTSEVDFLFARRYLGFSRELITSLTPVLFYCFIDVHAVSELLPSTDADFFGP